MTVFEWVGLAENVIAAAIGFGVRHAWTVYKAWRSAAGQGAILAGFEGPTLFVYPHRGNVPSAVLPRMATEDFLAINNLISAFLRIGHAPPEKVRDHDHLTDHDKKQNNLILICSSKSNPVTAEAIDRIRSDSRLADLVPFFEEDPTTKRVQIRWNRGLFPSDSFDQKGPEYDDIAVIIKAHSPWAAQRRILIVAGIRGFGTWGAAEFLKKWWRPLYTRKAASRARKTSKQGDFAALVSVHYKDSDIKTVKLLQLADLDEAYSRS